MKQQPLYTHCVVCDNKLHRDDAKYPTGYVEEPHCRRCARNVADRLEMERAA